ncbi:MAG: GWxTD domain-containing protein [Candidatus Aminicenantes bacterium]|nr:MAG: GWxTD domain-containing protein [Candidatus Aminicenantes bacterium]
MNGGIPYQAKVKESLVFLSMLLIILTAFSSFLSAKEDKYKKWLNEEVYWLMTPEEEKAFKKLKKDKDKDKFIALFWAKRDPTLFTEKNEFKEAYYSRLDYVNKKYTRGQEMGWKTEIGKILLFFGLPVERRTNPETWVYAPIRSLKIDEEFEVVFDAVENVGLALNESLTSKIALDAMDEFASRTIFHPDLKEVPDYSKKPIPRPGAFEKQIIEKVSAEAREHTDIPFDSAFYFTKAEKGATSITLVFFFNPKETRIEKTVLFGRAKTEGETPKDFRREVKVKKEDYYAQITFPLLPKKYECIFGLRDAKSERHSVSMKEIQVPNFWTTELKLGNLILTDRVEAIQPDSRETSAFNFEQFFAYPKKENIFKKSDTLNVLYQIYNAKIENSNVKLTQEISLKSEKRTYRLPESPFEREVPEGQVIVSGFPIPLTQIEPGEYELMVKITDKISNQVTEKAAKVVIAE